MFGILQSFAKHYNNIFTESKKCDKVIVAKYINYIMREDMDEESK